MKNEGLKQPVFEDMGTFVKVILYRPKGVLEVTKVDKFEEENPNKKNWSRQGRSLGDCGAGCHRPNVDRKRLCFNW